MNPTKDALKQAKRISGYLEGAYGPWFNEPPNADWQPANGRLGWAFAPGPDVDLPLEELIVRLDKRVEDVVREYRQQARIVVMTVAAVWAAVALASGLLGTPALAPIMAVALIPTAWLFIRTRGTDIALWRHQFALRWYLFEVCSKLKSMSPMDRGGQAELWRKAPFALAWVEGNWSTRGLVEPSEPCPV